MRQFVILGHFHWSIYPHFLFWATRTLTRALTSAKIANPYSDLWLALHVHCMLRQNVWLTHALICHVHIMTGCQTVISSPAKYKFYCLSSPQQYPNFGDLIKFSLNRCREKSPISWYRTVFTCLKNSFLQYKDENGYVDQLSGEWFEIKDLAKKFAMSMGFEPTKVRRPLVGIHRYTMLYGATCMCVVKRDLCISLYDSPPLYVFT